MKKYLLVFLLCFVATPALAANTSGYAWSESVGWFDFSNVTVSDTAVTGNAYNDNTGWLVFSSTTNDGTGVLSGYAWSESVGWFDFSDVTISSGSFQGYAYNDNTGWLSFESPVEVTTTWAPAVPATPETPTTSGGRSARSRAPISTVSSFPNNNTSNSGRDLQLGDIGSDVHALQVILNLIGNTIAAEGPGSPGNETEKFGALTKQALIKFQIENGITPAVGYYGPKTRAVIIQKLISLLLNTNN